MESSQGRIAGIYSHITPNPRLNEVDSCANQLRCMEADFAIALGGGLSLIHICRTASKYDIQKESRFSMSTVITTIDELDVYKRQASYSSGFTPDKAAI